MANKSKGGKIPRRIGKLGAGPTARNANHVTSSYWPGKAGTIVNEGPEVSEVKFEDGVYRFIPNDDIEH